MKTRTVVALAVALGLALGTTSPVSAALKLTLSDGVSPTQTFTDGMAGDTNAAAGILAVSTSIGVFVVSVSTVISKPVIGSANEASLSINSFEFSAAGAGTLTLTITDTSFTLPQSGSVGTSAAFGGAASANGTVTYASWVDTSNAEFGMATPIASIGPFGPGGAFSGSGGGNFAYTSPNPFSLTIQTAVTHTGASQFTNFSSVASAAVPEPGTLGLLGVGLLGLGIVGRRARRRSR